MSLWRTKPDAVPGRSDGEGGRRYAADQEATAAEPRFRMSAPDWFAGRALPRPAKGLRRCQPIVATVLGESVMDPRPYSRPRSRRGDRPRRSVSPSALPHRGVVRQCRRDAGSDRRHCCRGPSPRRVQQPALVERLRRVSVNPLVVGTAHGQQVRQVMRPATATGQAVMDVQRTLAPAPPDEQATALVPGQRRGPRVPPFRQVVPYARHAAPYRPATGPGASWSLPAVQRLRSHQRLPPRQQARPADATRPAQPTRPAQLRPLHTGIGPNTLICAQSDRQFDPE